MIAKHTTVTDLGGGWTPEGWTLTLACGHTTTGVPHMVFVVGDGMVCGEDHEEHTSPRPFQVGDYVRAAGTYGGEPAPGTIQTILDCDAKPGKHEAFACAFVRLDTPGAYDDGEPQPLAQVFLSADRTIPHDGETIVLITASEPIYLTINGLVMKRMSTDPDLEDLRDAGWDEIDAPEQDDDGTEAESLAEVSVPTFPDVLAHGRAPSRAMS